MSRRTAVSIAIAAAGAVIAAAAVAADQHWFDRHFLPSFLVTRQTDLWVYRAVRATIVVFGAGVVLAARPLAARVTSRGLQTLTAATVAAALALGASELVLARWQFRLDGLVSPDDEPRRRTDAHLGWTLVPSRSAVMSGGGRTIAFSLDANGYRVPRIDQPVDRDRPALIFIGESVIFGEGLSWEESIPGRVAALTGVQTANMAVHGYGSDQAYMRLVQELPRFRHPAGVVSLFMPVLFGRNLNDDRPHLAPGLVWKPPVTHARIKSLLTFAVPYRSDETIERGIRTTRDVLRATAEAARARGAIPLIVVPQFGPEDPVEQTLRQRVVGESGVPYVFVPIDGAWRLPWDRHPNAQAADVIARAIAQHWQPGVQRD